MKYLCPACERLVEIGPARLPQDVLFLRCVHCGVESSQKISVEPGSALRSVVPELESGFGSGTDSPSANVLPLRRPSTITTEAPAGFCPKCIAPRSVEARNCRSCGLVYQNYQVDEHRFSEPLLADWQALYSNWQDEGAHEAFLAAALVRDELSGAGRLYRIRLALEPGETHAVRAREEILRLASLPAQISAQSAAPPPAKGSFAITVFLVVSALGVMLWVAWFVVTRFMQAPA